MTDTMLPPADPRTAEPRRRAGDPRWHDDPADVPPTPPGVPPDATGDVPAGPPRPWRPRLAAGALAAALVAGGGTAGGLLADRYAGDPTAAASGTAASGTSASGTATGTAAGSLAPVVAAVSPSVVTVLVDGEQPSLGSGVILSSEGLVVTNNHVITRGGTVSLRLSDGRTIPARAVATDPAHDLALVQGSGLSGLTPATLGTDDSVSVGDTVLAFGSPLGLENTVTAGIVSAVNRDADPEGESLTGLLQTDAPINAGNSGGALVDTSGRVVGINVANATVAQDGGSVGVGFAIPADTVSTVVQAMRARLS